MRRRFALLALVSLLLVGPGCGTSSSGNPPADAGAGSDAETPPPTGDDDSGSPFVDAGGFYTGTITLTSSDGLFDLEASFVAAPPLTACPGTAAGSCCYVTASVASAPGPTSVDDGTIGVTDGSKTLGVFSFSDYSSGVDSASDLTLQWAPHDLLTVVSHGAIASAFTSSVRAPRPILGVSPLGAGSGPTPIARDSDWKLSWTPDLATGEEMIVALSASASGQPGDLITCHVADAAGSVTVPASLLGEFGAGFQGFVVMNRAASASATGTNVKVTVTAYEQTEGSATFP